MKITIGDYLITRLKEVGIKHIIGVPGDFNLQFLEQVKEHDGIEFVGASNELNAAYAADGYARENGLSALCVTYGVGDLGAIPGVAGSFAEHVPVIVISGAPPLFSMRNKYKVHHSLADGDFSNIKSTFEEFTVASAKITQQNAKEEIDRLIRLAILYKKPVHIQLPSNISYLMIDIEEEPLPQIAHSSDSERLETLTEDMLSLYKKAKSPYVLVDMDVDRLDVKDEIQKIIEKGQIGFAAISTGKAILDENHPLYIGIYKGDDSEPGVQEKIEGSDFLLTVSPRFIEWNSGTYSQDLPDRHHVMVARDYTTIGDEIYEGVAIKEVLKTFIDGMEEKTERKPLNTKKLETTSFEADKKLDQESFWKHVHPFLKEDDLIYGETGSASQALGGMLMPKGVRYVSSQIWGAIGHMLPALFGSLLANPKRRQLLFIGDGSFQVTGQELSRILYNDLNPIIFVIDNDGYTIERYIMGMKSDYNDIPKWSYAQLPEVFSEKNQMKTFKVHTHGELEIALKEAENISNGILIEVHFHQEDAPEALKKFGPAVADFNYGPRGPENEDADFE